MKYEHNFQGMHSILVILKNRENNETQEIGLSTSTSDPKLPTDTIYLSLMICDVSYKSVSENTDL